MIWKNKNTSSVITSTGGSAYVIELSRWGITQGIPAKPWINAHYITADNNIQGINNAIQWACDNGYNYIIMPKGSYTICYPRAIQIDRSYMTLDLNGSTFKVLYNSDTKSIFDTRTTTDYYMFAGQSFTFVNAHNSHLINGKIYGERLDRSFSNNAERAVEWTTGVHFRVGSSQCSIRNCEIAYYMADSIGFEPSAPAEMVEFGLTLTVNNLDVNTGAVIAATETTLVSQMLSIPAGNFNAFSITGQGTTRPTAIFTKDVGVFYYRADNSYIASLQNQKIYVPMTIPQGATKYKFVFYNETNTSINSSSQLAIHLKFGLNPHHNLIEWCDIYGNHRGGIQPGGSENVIQYNTIHDIGTAVGSSGLDLYGKPIFNDPTRYGINQEDFYGDAITIRNNLIYGCYCGILCGIYNATIENNRVYNAGNVGINLYTMFRGVVKNNFVWKCAQAIGLMGADFANTHVEISSNTLVGGSVDFRGDGFYHVIAEKNVLIDMTNITMLQLDNDMHVFKNNHIKYNSNYAGAATISINRIEGCTFSVRGNIQQTVTINTYGLINCSFSNATLRIYGRDETKQEKVKINDCRFAKCVLVSDVVTKRVKLEVSKSKFTDSILRVAGLNSTENPAMTVTDSDIFIKTITHMSQLEINYAPGYGIIELERCNIEISNTTGFQYLINNTFAIAASTLSFSLKGCNLSYTGGSPLSLVYYNNLSMMKSFISADNTFTNITLPSQDAGVYVGYDPLVKYKKTVSLATDGANFSATVTHNLNTLEPRVYCVTSSQIVQPTVAIIDANSVKITHNQNVSLGVTVTKN